MSISINPVQPKEYSTPLVLENKTNKKSNDKKKISPKVILSTLALAGVTTFAIVKLKGKGKKNPDIKSLAGKGIKVKDMTPEEKEKFIKELQAKTDNPSTKEEIRKLIESGEWDNL